ncbi:type III effector [Cupriavidus pampae]|uniref:Type III effector protein n=1 Tax=Cupriavidus pampae TaxID=659251 RepID=A0ABN7XYT0_9BURK|nr:type III effector [Cupriavidus pampae]CAG9166280.1 hypothetical protein LMG32289_00971 [Cupriavidus pampae]
MFKNPSVTGSDPALPLQPVEHSDSKAKPTSSGKAATLSGKGPAGLEPRLETSTYSAGGMRRRLNAPPATPQAAPATPAGPQLTPEQIVHAKAASIIQQLIVSGASWGVARKAFEDLIPAVGELIGKATAGKPAEEAGRLYGQIIGALIGNLAGGAALGAAHYTVEHGVKAVRQSIGGGVAQTPTMKSEATKQAIFIATFTTFMALKGLAKTYLPEQDHPMKDAAILYAIDVGFSAAGGATAEALTQRMSDGFGAVKANWQWNEFKARLIGGTAAGAVSALGDINAASSQPVDGLKLGKQSMNSINGAINSIMALSTWFLGRKVVTDNQAPATARTAVPVPAQPPADLAQDIEEFAAEHGDLIALTGMEHIVERERVAASAPSSPASHPAVLGTDSMV